MKKLHRDDLFGWSSFDPTRNIDFHSVLWVRPGGNVAIDPLALSDHDRAHLEALGGVAVVIVTNSDHVRDAARLCEQTGATLAAPRAERATFPIPAGRWLGDGEEIVAGLTAIELDGSKTPGELALLLGGRSRGAEPSEKTTLITGDLVRSHEGGKLHLLPDAKLSDRAKALSSLGRLVAHDEIEAVLVGDGWPVFRDGHRALSELLARCST